MACIRLMAIKHRATAATAAAVVNGPFLAKHRDKIGYQGRSATICRGQVRGRKFGAR